MQVNQLYVAVIQNDTAALKTAVQNGLDINTQYSEGQRYCLLDAIAISKYEMAKTILDLGFDVNLKGKTGTTALHLACSREIPFLLLERIAAATQNLNDQDSAGFTPLHHAAYSSSYEKAKFLLEKGVDANVRDLLNETAYDKARKNYEKELAALIEQYIKK